MPFEDTKKLEFNWCQKSDKVPFILYADLECLRKETDERKNNPKKSSVTEIGQHIHLTLQYLQYHHLKA